MGGIITIKKISVKHYKNLHFKKIINMNNV